MFTGLILDLGSVVAMAKSQAGVSVEVSTKLAGDLSQGDSIAVDGVCLTATALTESSFTADVMHETLKRSTLGELKEGASVNLELPPRAADRLGGHLVQGHVDTVSTVQEITEQGMARLVKFSLAPELSRYIVAQGSIAINGVSLTVVSVTDDSFSVALIPETLSRTNLGVVTTGERVNVEVDVLAKYVQKLIPN